MSFPVMQIQNVRYNFERIDERLIELQRHRYLSIVDIAITEGELSDFDAHSFFRSLLSHRVYRDHYIGRGSYEETGDKLLHGPYLIDRLRPEYYREMTLPALRQAFVDRMNDPEWVKYDGAPPQGLPKTKSIAFWRACPTRRCALSLRSIRRSTRNSATSWPG